MAAHLIGILGEVLNFFGALVLALDLFFRQRERQREESLNRINEYARANGLERTTYRRRENVSDIDFPSQIINSRTALFGFIGIGLLATGFLCLVGYHSLELYDLYHSSK